MYKLCVGLLLAVISIAYPVFAEVSIDAPTQKAMDIIAAGNKSGNLSQMQMGEKLLEALATKGNAGAAWNLAAYHYFDLPLKPQNNIKRCLWGLKAANLKATEAYTAAYLCSATKGKDKVDSFINHQLPWARRMVAEGDKDDQILGQRFIDAYEKAKLEDAGQRANTIGELLERFNRIASDR